MTRRDHLESAAAGGSRAARAELDEIDALDPGPGGYLWTWFLELHAGRGSNGFAPSPVGWQEIDCWSRLTKRRLAGWEVAALRELDQAYLEAQSHADGERAKQRQGPARPPRDRAA